MRRTSGAIDAVVITVHGPLPVPFFIKWSDWFFFVAPAGVYRQ